MASAEGSKLPIPATFSRALADFHKRLTAEQIEEFQFATFQSLQEGIQNIQKEQASAQGLRNLNKIRPFLDGLAQYSTTIELFVNMQPLLAAIWVASKLNQAFDTLLDAYERIGAVLPIIQVIDALFYSKPHIQQVLADVFEDILTFHKRAMVFFSHKTWKLTFRLTFHTFADMFGDVLKNLERSRGLLLQSASIAHYQEAQESRLQFTQEFQNRVKREKKEQWLAVIEWLSVDQAKHSSSTQHVELQQRRAEFPFTTQWLFNMGVMRGWMRKSDASSLSFWLSGIPGAGKTVLFSSVVDKIAATFPDAQVIYFYCKSSDHMRRTFEVMARTLIVQILDLNPACLDYLYEKMTASSERHPNSARLLQEIVLDLCINHDLLFVCIDGLDECEPNERSLILSLIGSITKASRADQSVRFFLTSRRENDIERSLSSAIRLNIKTHHVENDILFYIKTQVSKLRKVFGFPAEREREVREKLSSRPQGMFLLARLILDNLLAQDNLEDFDDEMDSDILPNGIEQALCKNRPEKSRQRAKFILEIMISASRALQSHEIQGALSIRVDSQTIDFNRRRSRISLGEICGPIVEVHSNGVIDMIHPTAKSYLLQHHSNYFIDLHQANFTMAKLCVTYLAFHCFDPNISDSEIQEYTETGDYAFQEYATCNWIHHMELSNDFLADNAIKEELDIFKRSYNLLRKVHARYYSWDDGAPEIVDFVEHKTLVKIDLKELRKHYSTESIFTKTSSNESIPCLFRQLARTRDAIEQFSLLPLPAKEELFVSAYGTSVYKCPVLTCSHFEDGFATRKLRDTHYQRHERPFKCRDEECDYSAIGFSTKSLLARHIRLCHETLTDQPVFPKMNRYPIDKALNDAIDKEDLIVIRTLAMELLDLPTFPTGFLMRSIKTQRRDCARVLVDILGDTKEVGHRDIDGNTILHILVEKGDEELVAATLDTQVNVNAVTRSNHTALYIAIRNCSVPIVRLLLQPRHAKGTLAAHRALCPTVIPILNLAVQADSDEILEILLAAGKEVFKDRNDIGNALEIAVGSSKRNLVATLLSWGRTLGVENKYPMAYHNWILPEVNEMVPVFMREVTIEQAREASIKKWGPKWEQRIREATLKGDITAVEQLLTIAAFQYAPIFSRISLKHGSVLGAAALYGNADMVRKLISEGIPIINPISNGNSAFENAAAGGYISILQLLLENGSNVNEETRFFSDGMALQRAAANGHYATVEFLLGLVALVDMTGTGPDNAETALVMAARSSSEATALLLLHYGADISSKSQLGESIIYMAARWGHQELVIKLLESGAAADELTARGNTVLMMAAANGLEIATFRLLRNEVVIDQINLRGEDWYDADGYYHPSSALFRAASNGHVRIVGLLLQAGADVNATSEHGQTALAIAKQNEHASTVDILRLYGAVLIYDSL
ncbi:Ankyrin [Lachnellula willkommii]|uniref:Ankyrin n=1 Tax=Lachnellula willkommii TaxID=215461 RepID=A0A559MD02_9HELO|nr:Ankyrin [Lachnellula willkommii]